jgi:hypothetical protein
METPKEKKILSIEEVDSLLVPIDTGKKEKWIGFSLIDITLNCYSEEGKLPAPDEIDSLLGLVSTGEMNAEYFEKTKTILDLVGIELLGLKLIVKLKK